jgi:ABC-2 type transport system permease protein
MTTIRPLSPTDDTRRDAPAAERTGSWRQLGTVLRLTWLELRLQCREPMVAVSLLAFPALVMLVIAGAFGQGPDPDFAGARPDRYYVIGYVGVVFASLGLTTMPTHIADLRERGVLRRLRAAGVEPAVVVAAEAIVGAVLCLGAGAVVLAVGHAVYGVDLPADPLATAGWLAVGIICFVAIGLALGFGLTSSRAASVIGNVAILPMFLLGGGGPPRAVLSPAMRRIADLLPLTHVTSGSRDAWLEVREGDPVVWWPLLITVVAAVLAVRWAGRARDTGR